MAVEPDTYPNSNVYINKLGITDHKTLEAAEADFCLIRAEQYRNKPLEGCFNLDHLQAIHQLLFGDLYTWAGQLRGYDMRKGICEFTPHKQIRHYANIVYGELAQEDYLLGREFTEIVIRLAYYYDMTNRLHPFPEGNGRTQRLFN
jgi:cell filamentation protein